MKRAYTHEDAFDSYINDYCGDTIKICGYEYEPSIVLKVMDPLAYHTEYMNWIDDTGREY